MRRLRGHWKVVFPDRLCNRRKYFALFILNLLIILGCLSLTIVHTITGNVYFALSWALDAGVWVGNVYDTYVLFRAER